MKAAHYSIVTIPNKGADPQHPAAVWPFIVFIRCHFNPLASAWTFARTQAEADAKHAALAAHLGEELGPTREEPRP